MICRCVFCAVVALLAAASPILAVTVTSAVLSGPSSIKCPPDGNCATYTLALAGGDASSYLANWMNFAVYQDETIDDMLINETVFYVFGDANGNWTYSTTFQLCCTDGCEVTGSYASCWDSTAQVYALIEDSWGFDLKETNRLTVKCEIPEPGSVLLIYSGLGALGLFAARTRR
ncbi:MAG: PEP-CTERM sorting domain-containing protein [Acidobacteria bacterium]|nr:PEP-CTERM sorting domain-containing protein [Acidobacteriota bacterium]